MSKAPRIAVIGLGNIGLAAMAATAGHFPTIGMDIGAARVGEPRKDPKGMVGAADNVVDDLRGAMAMIADWPSRRTTR